MNKKKESKYIMPLRYNNEGLWTITNFLSLIYRFFLYYLYLCHGSAVFVILIQSVSLIIKRKKNVR